MASDVATIVVDSGLIPDSALLQLQRWGSPVKGGLAGPVDTDMLPSLIEHAMQEEEYVKIRSTDLDLMDQYMRTQEPARLHLGDGGAFDVVVGRTLLGEYVFAWDTEKELVEMLLTPGTYLATSSGSVEFADARDLFYGERMAFVVCTPR